VRNKTLAKVGLLAVALSGLGVTREAGVAWIKDFPDYRRTVEALEQYRRLALQDDSERLPNVRKPIDPGDSYDGVPRLVRLLGMLGDLPDAAIVPANSRLYGGPIVEAVKRFQARHGLEIDGRIGTATLAQLNTPLDDRVRQLELALERWRSLPR